MLFYVLKRLKDSELEYFGIYGKLPKLKHITTTENAFTMNLYVGILIKSIRPIKSLIVLQKIL